MEATVLLRMGLPLVMAVGGILAWRKTMKGESDSSERPAWRDTSLDDWYKERDEQLEAERLARQNGDTPGTPPDGPAS